MTRQSYVEGQGELLRARRNYMGLDPVDLAELLGFNADSGAQHVKKIERNQKDCPEAVFTRVAELTRAFDVIVDDLIEDWETNGAPEVMPIVRGCDPLYRAAAGRAAVEYGNITPIIVGGDQPQTARKAG
ncbi:helix-turn-helix DNA binding domain protein [Gordonia phage Wooper]|nr:helix-turn-helix DNA binding domain protein [Gordonia phage Wooper]